MASCLLTKLVLPLHQTTINSCQLPRPKHFIKPLHHQGYHRIHYCVYQKPHHKYTIHPRHIFTGIIKTETTRYIRLSITFDDFDYIHKIFRLGLYTSIGLPPSLINSCSFPWLPNTLHKRRKTNRQQHTKKTDSNQTIYDRTKSNKHIRTDKTVQQILCKYHNMHVPKFCKAYCNSKKLFSTLLTNKSLHKKLVV